ncbi:hypothetical protein BKP45_14595 [Anaerobacillus alkalidiazotrophicus]|uniref:Peptidylprolyl isomerase n=1 Tax=Anaerobacillus alkalidiazotrophicus TaxID=472963 RepID=A0A1S2M3C8_9BACI|nr:SurA N-terminal domain-containing protein [Anaerobacillus alkalidiazotrophicus]OIJ18953.1 hypothetical protein BKP45_14595 [Anaerobacillus alkalidiazotrophicus]
MIKRTLLLIVLGMLTFVVIGCGNVTDEGEAAAVVNEEVITFTDFNLQVENTKQMYEQQGIDIAEQGEEFLAMIKENVLNNMIDEKLLTQASADYVVLEEEVEEQFLSVKSDFESEEQFHEALELNNLTNETFKERIQEQLKIDQFLSETMNEVVVTEEDLEEAYAQVKEMGEEDLDFEEIKPVLEQSVVQQKKEEEFMRVLSQLKDQADIEIFI